MLLLCLLLFFVSVESAPFITRWNTSIVYEFPEGQTTSASRRYETSPTNQIILGITDACCDLYNFVVDWGDGSSETITHWEQGTHIYAEDGVYDVTMEGQIEGWGIDNYDWDAIKLIEISQWGDLKLTDGGGWFESCLNLDITATDSPDLTEVFNYNYGFQFCSSLTNVDFTAWDTSRATSLALLFPHAHKFNGDISTWDVSSVTSFSQTFYKNHAFNGDVSQWDISSAWNFGYMFDYCYEFNQDISSWDVSRATNIARMLGGNWAFNQDINNWDTSSATSLYGTFMYTRVFDQELSNWDVSNVGDMAYTFGWATGYTKDLSAWDTSSAFRMTVPDRCC